MTKTASQKLTRCRNKLDEVNQEKRDLQDRLTSLNKSIFDLNQELGSLKILLGQSPKKSRKKK